jgi:putative endonuclease
MSNNRTHVLGRYGEQAAANYLSALGYEIVERNFSCRAGEIDLIAKDRDSWVFVEVKTRSGSGYGDPFEAITDLKLAKMRRTIAQWRSVRQIQSSKMRLDAVSVLVTAGRVHIEHLKQVA